MATQHLHWTPSGVRMRLHRVRDGEANWLFLPGGPGIGSERLRELVDAVAVSGCSWLVERPRDGSNANAPGAPANPCSLWDRQYRFAWWPTTLPTLVVSGSATGSSRSRCGGAFAGENAIWRVISDAGHFPWIEQPDVVREVFAELEQRIGLTA
ncbi:alpha/beta fold hydrolase [Mycobacterium sp. ML4]